METPCLIINKDYEIISGVPTWVISCYDQNNVRSLLWVQGDGVYPSFGVPYDEFWKIRKDKRISWYRRGPDSPLGEPVMEVATYLPADIGGDRGYFKRTNLDPIRDTVSHSYCGDIKFEKKVSVDKGITDNYITVDFNHVDEFGFVDDKYVQPLPQEKERFHVNTLKVAFDSEWKMDGLLDADGFLRIGNKPITDKKYKKAQAITLSFLDNKDWVFECWTWHPTVKKSKEAFERYISRVKEEFRKRIPQMPKDYKVIVHKCTNEKEVLAGMIDYLNRVKPDCLIGFNSFSGWHGIGTERRWMNGFDMPWLYFKAKDYGLPVNRMSPIGEVYDRQDFGKWQIVIKMVTEIDVFHEMAFFKYHQKDKLKNEKLDTFMNKYLGIGKIQHEGWVWDFWIQHPKEEREYNMADVEGTMALELMFGPSEDTLNRSTFCGAKWEDGMAGSVLQDQVNLNLYHGEYYLDTKYQREGEGESAEFWSRNWVNQGFTDAKVGGWNKDPNVGMHKWEVGGDFKKFYPNAGMASNAGPETFINIDHTEWDWKDGLVVVDKRQCLKHEVEDWEAYVEEMGEDQDAITKDLIGWKFTKYKWSDLIWTPACLFRKDIESKNIKAFTYFAMGRDKLQKEYKRLKKEKQTEYDMDVIIAYNGQFSFKSLTNVRFGVTGMTADRTYMLPIFNTYTLVCQAMLKEADAYLTSLGYDADLTATDSLFFEKKLPPEWIDDGDGKCHDKEAKEIMDKVNEHVWEFAKHEFNIDHPEKFFFMETESICDWFYIRNKKFYLKHVYWKDDYILKKPEIEFKGVKKVRKETAELSDAIQTEIADRLNGSRTQEEEYCLKIHEDFQNLPIQSLCKVLPLKQALDAYSESSEQWKAFTFGKLFGLDPSLGDRYFVAPVKTFPAVLNGRRVDPRLGDVIAFDEETLPRIEEAGVIFDRAELEDRAVAGPADELLARFGVDCTYWNIINKPKTGDPFGEF